MSRDLTGPTWRAGLLLPALLTQLVGVPAPVPGVLAGFGLVAVLDGLVSRRGLGLADRVLLVVGGTVVALVLIGVVLGSTPLGLSGTSWVVALVVVGAVGVTVHRAVPGSAPDPAPESAPDPQRSPSVPALRTTLLLVPWVVAAVLVVAVSVRLSVTAQRDAEVPPLELSFGRIAGGEVDVVVSASEDVGPLEVRTTSPGSEISYPLLTVEGDETETVTVALPATGRFVVTLGYPDQTQPLRTLVLDR